MNFIFPTFPFYPLILHFHPNYAVTIINNNPDHFTLAVMYVPYDNFVIKRFHFIEECNDFIQQIIDGDAMMRLIPDEWAKKFKPEPPIIEILIPRRIKKSTRRKVPQQDYKKLIAARQAAEKMYRDIDSKSPPTNRKSLR
jgi:hypothetical protein